MEIMSSMIKERGINVEIEQEYEIEYIKYYKKMIFKKTLEKMISLKKGMRQKNFFPKTTSLFC
jgi:uncharacterized protein YjbK